MMATDFNDGVAGLSLSSGGNFSGEAKADDHPNSISRPSPSSLGDPRPNTTISNQENNMKTKNDNSNKKSVRFSSEIAICGLGAAPRASGVSSQDEKSIRWYAAADFDRFKRGAARDAGVKIIRYGAKKGERSHHFVMVGDFDGQLGAAAGTESGAADAAGGAAKVYYNENEYGDARDGRGGTVCRRGLGYHFSRARKQSRAVARATVAAWQGTLADLAGPTAAAGGGEPGRAARARLTLALVSARCSRTAREEARWRGDVDYRVAHPERHVGPSEASSPSESGKSDPADGKRGPQDNGADVTSKRQKTDGGCRSHVGGLSPSPTPDGVLSSKAVGMLQAEV